MKKLLTTALVACSSIAFSQDIVNINLCGADMLFNFRNNYTEGAS